MYTIEQMINYEMEALQLKAVLNIAHRGAAGYCPENTMIAFKRSIELGATAIETDVQMTADGHLVLIHDELLKRTTGSPKLVKDVTLAELQQLDAGSWFDPQFKSEVVPTLEQLLEFLQPLQVQLNQMAPKPNSLRKRPTGNKYHAISSPE